MTTGITHVTILHCFSILLIRIDHFFLQLTPRIIASAGIVIIKQKIEKHQVQAGAVSSLITHDALPAASTAIQNNQFRQLPSLAESNGCRPCSDCRHEATA